jgi:hypothetical protein
MLWTIAAILLVLWALGRLVHGRRGAHRLRVIAAIVVVLQLIGRSI